MVADKIDVTIQIDTAEAGRLDEVVQALKARGLDRVESHPRFMIVNGSIAPEALEALRSVKGVISVQQDKTYKTQ